MLRKLILSVVITGLFASTNCYVANAQEKSFTIPETDEGLPGDGPIRRYEWFRSLWQKKRSTWSGRIQADQKSLVFLGDSITHGWGDNLGGSFSDVKVANRGISGDTTRGMLIRLKEDVLSLNPAGVVMLMGTNDLEEGAKPKTIADNVKLIVAELKKHNEKMPIVLCNVFPSSSSKKRSARDIQEINKLYAAAVKGDSQITVVDTWTLFANEDGDAKKEEFPDLLHPNKAGYAKWAAALRPILATTGFLETDDDQFVLEPGFTSLFNGKDLTGWGFHKTPEAMRKRRKNNPSWPVVEEDISFDGKTSTPDGRYVAMNGRLIVTTPPEGRKFQQLWTTKEFGDDFVLKLEFRATPNADSGVFIRKPQLQCRDFVLAGPWKELDGYRPQQWNELVVNVKGEVAYCTCNGELLNAEFKVPATGPIGIEGDRGQIEYRRIRIGKDDGNLLKTTNTSTSWVFEETGKGKGSMEIEGDSVVFKTTEVSEERWHVQAYQRFLNLKDGNDYKVTFKLRSPEKCTVVLNGLIHEPDWTWIGINEEIQTTPEFKDYEFTFTAEGTAEFNNRLGFMLGVDKGSVTLKDFRMVEN